MSGSTLYIALIVTVAVSGVLTINRTLDDNPHVEFRPARLNDLVIGETASIFVELTVVRTDCITLDCALVSCDIAQLEQGGNVTTCGDLKTKTTLIL